ncbi:glycine zipper 2TM domain-containing protein [Noviherbaspirillum aerium]|uniref:glycine zipper 2TM domain-containing protein n=1 Tax=Noviherbaspirillum aerium TaxID=2588497 RepID=UPI00124E8C2D|nr:glycine zipper 2TM domain-containing protein [Noviherbaspirillum aerium]
MLNNKTRLAKPIAAGFAAILLAACGSSPNTASTSSYPMTTTGSSIPVTTTSSTTGYGVIQAIDVVPGQAASGGVNPGVGTVAGAVVGGVLGNQVGSGSGRTAATVAGAAGGALAGRALTRNSSGGGTGDSYRVAVRMDNGSVQTLVQDVQPGVQVGERVRLENGVIVERFR